MITDALERLGNSPNGQLRRLNLAAMLGTEEVPVPAGTWANRPGLFGPDAVVLGDLPTLVEVKRSSKLSKRFGPHIVSIERIHARGMRTDDPDAAEWFAEIQRYLAYLPEAFRNWHALSPGCFDSENASPCSGWAHAIRRDRACVGVPQVAVYLFCNALPTDVQVNATSRLVLLGGDAETVWGFYDSSVEDFGPNPSRFVMTTHSMYLNRLGDGLRTLAVDARDMARVRDLATAMWQDMTWEEAGDLAPAAHDLVDQGALDAWACPCLPCRMRRTGSAPSP